MEGGRAARLRLLLLDNDLGLKLPPLLFPVWLLWGVALMGEGRHDGCRTLKVSSDRWGWWRWVGGLADRCGPYTGGVGREGVVARPNGGVWPRPFPMQHGLEGAAPASEAAMSSICKS